MKKTFYGALIISLLILLVSCYKDSGDPAGQNLNSGKFTIVYTGNVGGKVNPCGCRIPLGGFARRSTVIDEIRKDAGDVLILDSGALLYPHYYMYSPYDYIQKIIAHLIMDVNNDIGMDALNVSSYDIANSPDSLLVFDRTYPAKWLSANMVRKDSGELIYKADAVFTAGDFRVGVFGFMAQKSQGIDIFDEDAPVRVLDPYETARKEVAKLQKDNDIIIALSYMNLEKVKKLVEEVPGINIVIASHTREHTPSSDHYLFQPVTINNTIIVRCPDGGRVIGRLDLVVANGSLEFIESSKIVDLRPASVKEKDKTFAKSTYKNTFIDLGPGIKRAPAIQEKIDIFSKRVYAFTDSIGLDYKIQ